MIFLVASIGRVAPGLASTVPKPSHIFPREAILEIGAGAGGTELKPRYTDTGFFEAATNKFADFEEKMVFKTLEIGNNVSSQKFKENFYDIIIATNVLRATPNISTTLETTRSLRKPSGFCFWRKPLVSKPCAPHL
ncbi:hypothetical protein McaMca56_008076 [Microsporum canis]